MSEQGGALVFMSGQKQRINIGFRKEGRELSVVTSFFPPEKSFRNEGRCSQAEP